MQSPEQQVVLSLPAGGRFGGVARSAVGALARRGGFSALQWARLEAAVDRTLRLLQHDPGDRVRLTFGDEEGSGISVEARVTTTERDGPTRGAHAPSEEAERVHAELTALVEAAEVDPDGAWVRFRASRR